LLNVNRELKIFSARKDAAYERCQTVKLLVLSKQRKERALEPDMAIKGKGEHREF
jgi:hypothetical protein